jgi:hypothetical protein
MVCEEDGRHRSTPLGYTCSYDRTSCGALRDLQADADRTGEPIDWCGQGDNPCGNGGKCVSLEQGYECRIPTPTPCPPPPCDTPKTVVVAPCASNLWGWTDLAETYGCSRILVWFFCIVVFLLLVVLIAIAIAIVVKRNNTNNHS